MSSRIVKALTNTGFGYRDRGDMGDNRNQLPPAVVSRLTKYLAHVQQCCNEGEEWVSSIELAQRLGLTSSTVRQDLSHVDFYGVSKRGYATEGLRRVLADLLGADKTWRMVVVGAGHLGQALAQHEEFQRRGLCICGIFDNDRQKIGTKVGKLSVHSMRALPAFIGGHGIDIGVVAVPAPAAQYVADLLIASGIRGILNLTLAHIVSPRNVPVIDSRIVASLLELTHAVKQQTLPDNRK
jgi:redox-sensing transcriptional repressor